MPGWTTRAGARTASSASTPRCARSLDAFSWLIYRINTPVLRDMFMEPRNRFRMRDGLVSLLAGNTRGGLRVRLPILAFKSAYHALSLAYRFGYRLQEGRLVPAPAAAAAHLTPFVGPRRPAPAGRGPLPGPRPVHARLRALEAAARPDPAGCPGSRPAGALRGGGRPCLRSRPARGSAAGVRCRASVLTGLDWDERLLADAAPPPAPAAAFRRADLRTAPVPDGDTVLLIDILYLMPRELQLDLLRRAAAAARGAAPRRACSIRRAAGAAPSAGCPKPASGWPASTAAPAGSPCRSRRWPRELERGGLRLHGRALLGRHAAAERPPGRPAAEDRPTVIARRLASLLAALLLPQAALRAEDVDRPLFELGVAGGGGMVPRLPGGEPEPRPGHPAAVPDLSRRDPAQRREPASAAGSCAATGCSSTSASAAPCPPIRTTTGRARTCPTST